MNAESVPFVPTRDDLINYISDTYKEVNGFRPRVMWSEFAYDELDNWGRQLSVEAQTARKQRVQSERIERKLRHARHVLWVEKKRAYFVPTNFTFALIINL